MLIRTKLKNMMNITKLIAIPFFIIASSLSAQDIANHAFGIRLGESDGFGASLSYQKSIGRYNRFEIDLSYQNSREFKAAKAIALYQSVYRISNSVNWYYGFGGGVGTVNFEPEASIDNPNVIIDKEGGLFVLASGNIGIEANFNLPLLISIDIRPELGLLGVENFDNKFNFDFGLGIRYPF